MSALAEYLRPRLRLSVPWPEWLAVSIDAEAGDAPTTIEWTLSGEEPPGEFWVEWGDGSRTQLTESQQTVVHTSGSIWLRYVTGETMAAWPLT